MSARQSAATPRKPTDIYRDHRGVLPTNRPHSKCIVVHVRLTCCARAEYTVEENEDDKGNTTQVKRAHTFINCNEFVKLQPAA